MKGPRLTHGAVPLVAAVSTVQLVVASLCDRVAHGPAGKMTGRHRPLARHPAGELVRTAAPASLLVLPRLGTVPLPVAALFLSEATSRRSPAAALPRWAVAPDVERGVEAASLRVAKSLVRQRQQAGVGLDLD